MPEPIIVPASKTTAIKSSGEIKLTTASLPQSAAGAASTASATPAAPAAATPPPSASEDFYGALRKKAEPQSTEPAKTPTDFDKPTDDLEKTLEGEPPNPEEAKTETPATTEPAKKEKVNPWKLVEELKQARAKAEKDYHELRKLLPDEAARKVEMDRLKKAEERAKQLEDEIRTVDYTKSTEFAEKYEKPYNNAWKQAVADLKEITVLDEAGNPRSATPQDLMEIINLPLSKAKEVAQEMFGDFANEALSHRKEIRRLFEERNEGIARAKEESAERATRAQQERELRTKEIHATLKQEWERANEAAIADPENGEFFKPVEGDDERNQLLESGYKLVDTAFGQDPLNEKLSTEERATIIKRHAAVRNRAAAYGTLKYLLRKEREARLAAEEKLKQFNGSTPTTEGGQRTTPSQAPTGSAWSQVTAALHAKVK